MERCVFTINVDSLESTDCTATHLQENAGALNQWTVSPKGKSKTHTTDKGEAALHCLSLLTTEVWYLFSQLTAKPSPFKPEAFRSSESECIECRALS